MTAETLKNRITAEQIEALRTRQITNRSLAKQLGVTEFHLSRTFPGHKIGKIAGPVASAKREKKQLRLIRDDFRAVLAMKVKNRQLSVEDAAKTAHCSVRTMYRHVAKLETRRVAPIAALV